MLGFHGLSLYSQDVPLAGAFGGLCGPGPDVSALPQWAGADPGPTEADTGSPGWGHRDIGQHRTALDKV